MKQIGWAVKEGRFVLAFTTRRTRTSTIDHYLMFAGLDYTTRTEWATRQRRGIVKLIRVYVEAKETL